MAALAEKITSDVITDKMKHKTNSTVTLHVYNN